MDSLVGINTIKRGAVGEHHLATANQKHNFIIFFSTQFLMFILNILIGAGANPHFFTYINIKAFLLMPELT